MLLSALLGVLAGVLAGRPALPVHIVVLLPLTRAGKSAGEDWGRAKWVGRGETGQGRGWVDWVQAWHKW